MSAELALKIRRHILEHYDKWTKDPLGKTRRLRLLKSN